MRSRSDSARTVAVGLPVSGSAACSAGWPVACGVDSACGNAVGGPELAGVLVDDGVAAGFRYARAVEVGTAVAVCVPLAGMPAALHPTSARRNKSIPAQVNIHLQ